MAGTDAISQAFTAQLRLEAIEDARQAVIVAGANAAEARDYTDWIDAQAALKAAVAELRRLGGLPK